eukprot:598602-Amphidinium_carterae.1
MQRASGQVEAMEERPNTQNSCVCVKWINAMGVVGILALKECFPFTLLLLLPSHKDSAKGATSMPSTSKMS